MSQEDLVQSLRRLQRFAGLNETGILDAATIKLMGQSRCGMPDVGASDSAKRRRRYVLQGTSWKKKVCAEMVLIKKFCDRPFEVICGWFIPDNPRIKRNEVFVSQLCCNKMSCIYVCTSYVTKTITATFFIPSSEPDVQNRQIHKRFKQCGSETDLQMGLRLMVQRE